jgi:hypothetical protein
MVVKKVRRGISGERIAVSLWCHLGVIAAGSPFGRSATTVEVREQPVNHLPDDVPGGVAKAGR